MIKKNKDDKLIAYLEKIYDVDSAEFMYEEIREKFN